MTTLEYDLYIYFTIYPPTFLYYHNLLLLLCDNTEEKKCKKNM